MQWMVFDVESVGLHGEGFAFGYVVIDERGVEYDHGEFGCMPSFASAENPKVLEWVKDNCRTPRSCSSPAEVRETFWDMWLTHHDIPGTKVVLAADVAWPVEARFLAQVLDDDIARRSKCPIYPLIDIASVRLAAGLDPLATCRRYPEEMPAHSPLADARQSARLLLEALQIINRGVVLG